MKITNTMKLVALTGTSLAVLSGAGMALAATTDTSSTNMASRIATKLGLKQEDVTKVLDAEHSIRDEDRQVRITARLDQLVKDGKITADQKTKIEAKQKELQATREANKDTFQSLTQAERKAKMDAERTALETWAKDNSIDIQYVMFGGHGGKGGKGGMRGMMHDIATDNDKTSTTSNQ